MTGKKKITIILLLCLVMPFPSFIYAQELARNTLRGVESVYIMMDELSPGLEKRGLFKDALVEEIAIKLNEVDIHRLTKEEWEKCIDKPVLYINISTVKTGLSYYVYSMNIQFFQKASLLRDPSIQKLSMTWRTQGYLGFTRGKNLSKSIHSGMEEIINEFVADYLTANPDNKNLVNISTKKHE